MHFIVTGFDGTDENALSRRMAVREAHLAGTAKMRLAGTLLFGAAILDDAGKMIGSSLVVDFPTRQDVDAWLKEEAYVRGNVWRSIDVRPCKISTGLPKS
jgi:uncharacterized protein YciI